MKKKVGYKIKDGLDINKIADMFGPFQLFISDHAGVHFYVGSKEEKLAIEKNILEIFFEEVKL